VMSRVRKRMWIQDGLIVVRLPGCCLLAIYRDRDRLIKRDQRLMRRASIPMRILRLWVSHLTKTTIISSMSISSIL